MADSPRKKLLDSMLNSLIAASETSASVKLLSTFAAQISSRFGDLPDKEKELLADVTAEDLKQAILRLEFSTKHSAEAAAGVYRIEESQAEILAAIKTLDDRTSPPPLLENLSNSDCEVLKAAGDTLIKREKLGDTVSVVDAATSSVRNLMQAGYFDREYGDIPRWVNFTVKGFERYLRAYRPSFQLEFEKICSELVAEEWNTDHEIAAILEIPRPAVQLVFEVLASENRIKMSPYNGQYSVHWISEQLRREASS